MEDPTPNDRNHNLWEIFRTEVELTFPELSTYKNKIFVAGTLHMESLQNGFEYSSCPTITNSLNKNPFI